MRSFSWIRCSWSFALYEILRILDWIFYWRAFTFTLSGWTIQINNHFNYTHNYLFKMQVQYLQACNYENFGEITWFPLWNLRLERFIYSQLDLSRPVDRWFIENVSKFQLSLWRCKNCSSHQSKSITTSLICYAIKHQSSYIAVSTWPRYTNHLYHLEIV